MTEETVKRRLAAIVAADMVGYSRLMGLDETGTVTRQKACLNELILPRIREFNGRLVKTTGDGLLAEFASAVDAVLCAVAVQREMVEREADIAEDRRITYRVGINVGEIIYDGDDIFGDGVNVAARLEALAEPGGIRISETVFNNVKGKLDLGFADLGAQKVKNIAEPVPTYKVLLNPEDAGKVVAAAPPTKHIPLSWAAGLALVAILGIGAYILGARFLQAPAPGPTETRLLILPYQPASPGAQVHADAVSENLWLTMARLRGMTIVARDDAMTLKGVDPTPTQISQFGAATDVLDGTVAVSGDKVTISSRLRHMANGSAKTVWQQESALPVADMFDALNFQKTSVTSSLKVPLNANEREILEQKFTRDPKAFLLYAQAEHLFETSHWNNYAKAMALFEQASKLDPEFLEAKIGYAKVNYRVWRNGWSNVRNTLQARIAAEKTIEDILSINPADPEAISLKVGIKMFMLEHEAALDLARGLIFKNSASPLARKTLGWALLANADYDAARAEFDVFAETAPRLSLADIIDFAGAYLRLDDPQRALSLLKPYDDDKVGYHSTDWSFAEAYARAGNLEAAKRSMQRVFQGVPYANLQWMRPLMDFFKDPSVFEAYSTAMQAAGMPEWPYNFDKTHAADRLDNKTLTELFNPGVRAVDATGPLGGKFGMTVRPDGTVEYRFSFLADPYRGTWEIVGDTFCTRFPDLYKGRQMCDLFFTDRENSTAASPRYIQLHVFGMNKFGIERLAEE